MYFDRFVLSKIEKETVKDFKNSCDELIQIYNFYKNTLLRILTKEKGYYAIENIQMTEGKRNIIHQLLDEYDIQSAEDIQEALKDLLGGTIKEMMEAEMDDHLGYEKSQRSDVTDKLLPQIEDWQNRPLDEIYPIVYIDAIHYSVRDNGVIREYPKVCVNLQTISDMPIENILFLI